MSIFLQSLSSEWLKRKRTAAAWLVVIGGVFIPSLVVFARVIESGGLAAANESPQLWEALYARCWQFMGFFLLPIGVILATSLITQLEFRNNSWKQLHTTPQPLYVIFFSKLTVVLAMLVQWFVLFNICIYLTGVLPCLFVRHVPYPPEPIPWRMFLEGSSAFFLDALPIVALQYLVSLQWKNFLAPLGVGFGLYVASVVAVHWRYGYWVPYTYCYYESLGARSPVHVSIHGWAAGYFLLFTVVGYILYISKKEKG